ncbi:MAG: SDR family oxidoreductase [Bacteroidales bacterium]
MYNPFSLKNKNIFIAGASSGIGKETAIECAKLGAKLVISGRNKDRLRNTLDILEGCNHKMVIADLLNKEELLSLVDEVEPFDGLVISVGIRLVSPFIFDNRKKLDKVFNSNFFVPIELIRLLVKYKKIKKNSSIVLVSSVGGVFVTTSGSSIYDASKAALNSMMKSCAKELSVKKIRVNSVNPGLVDTPLIHIGDTMKEEQIKSTLKDYPLGRHGKPIDIAHGIIYLLSDASSWVTGITLRIDGGLVI